MSQSGSTERIGNVSSKQAKQTSEDRSATDPHRTSQHMYDIMHTKLLEFQFQKHSLRISASNVAAMTGYHPYKNLPELLVQLVYQGRLGGALLQKDSQLLGLTLVTPQEALNELAKKAGVDKTLKKALQTVKKGEVKTIEKAQALKLTLASQEVKKHLSPSEWEQFREGIRGAVDTNYGIVHENAALDEYQKLCGWPISERNASIRSWAFARSEDVVGEDGSEGEKRTAIPIKEAESLPARQIPTEHDDDERTSNKKQKTVVDLTDVPEKLDAECNVNLCSNSPPETISVPCLTSEESLTGKDTTNAIEVDIDVQAPQELVLTNDKLDPVSKANMNTEAIATEMAKNDIVPYFYILGSVDGIRDELAPTNGSKVSVDFDDDDSWNIRSIIVECKHRMRRLHSPPPLYEQIQASIYCLMYGVDDADIVQVLRQDNKTTTSKSEKINDRLQSTLQNFVKKDGVQNAFVKEKGGTESDQHIGKPQLLVSRVSLDDPALQHKSNWTTIVLPRLRAFVDAVYLIRSSDDLRYRLMASSSESELGSFAAWEFLHEHCPWLAQCDTAFRRVNKIQF